MENKFQSHLGGRVALSAYCEGRIETIGWNQMKYGLIFVGLDMSLKEHSGLLDQRIIL